MSFGDCALRVLPQPGLVRRRGCAEGDTHRCYSDRWVSLRSTHPTGPVQSGGVPQRIPLELPRISDVNIVVSASMALGFLWLCLVAVWWILRTGCKLKA
jgi:hypothetical protein